MNRVGAVVIGFIGGAVALTLGMLVFEVGDILSLMVGALIGIALYGLSRYW